MRRLTSLVIPLILIMLFGGLASAQKYLWPTEASDFMTSNFCEFRPRHYHAAIDIKTWNRSGYKIFAVQDGYVYRLRVAATGYGKAVYLKLKDGNFAIYAHLQGFTDALNAYSDQRRLDGRSNIIDEYLKPEQFPVKKGDLLGYTGETGIGVPHLHFEIRNKHHQPINPLQFYRDKIDDRITPRGRYLAVIPADGTSFVNFKPDTLIKTLKQAPIERISKPIYLNGRAYLAMRAYDMANGVNNRFDMYRAEMFVNDSLVYQIRYDRFSYDETRLLELDKNFSLWRKGLRIYHNFYRHPSNSLPFYGQTPPGGGMLSAENLREGKNKVVIYIYDYHDNRCKLTIPIIYHRDVPVTVTDITHQARQTSVELKSRQPLENIRVGQVSGNRKKILPVAGLKNIPREEVLSSFYYYRLEFPNRSKAKAPSYKISAAYGEDLPVLPFYISGAPGDAGLSPDLDADIRFYDDHLAVKLNGQVGTELPNRWPGATFFQFEPQRFLMTMPLTTLQEMLQNPPAEVSPLLKTLGEWHDVRPGKSRRVQSDDGIFQVYFPSNAVYHPIHVRIDRQPMPAEQEGDYQLRSAIYQVEPYDEPFNYGAEVRFNLPDSLAGLKGLGAYYLSKRRRWAFLPTKYDPAKKTLSTRVTSLERFALIMDSIPPVVVPLNLRRFNARKSRHPALKFSVKDAFSGIYRETQIQVYLNGQWTLYEFDPELDRVIVAARHIPRGKHSLRIRVNDNAGNVTVKTFEVHRQ